MGSYKPEEPHKVYLDIDVGPYCDSRPLLCLKNQEHKKQSKQEVIGEGVWEGILRIYIYRYILLGKNHSMEIPESEKDVRVRKGDVHNEVVVRLYHWIVLPQVI